MYRKIMMLVMVILLFGGWSTVQARDEQLDIWLIDIANFKAAQDHYLEGFQARYPDVKLNVTKFPYGQIQEKMMAAFIAGNEPDFLEIMSQALQLPIRKGRIAAIPESLYSNEYLEENLVEAALKEFKFRGKYYAFPTSTGVYSGCLIYNKDLVAKYGVDVESLGTWDELINTAQKMTKWKNGRMIQSGLSVHDCEEEIFWSSLILTAGGRVLSPDGTKAGFNTSIGQKVTQDYSDFFNKYKVDSVHFPGVLSATNNFVKGSIAMFPEGPWVGPWLEAGFPEFNYGIAAAPSYVSGKPWRIAILVSEAWAVTEKAKNKEIAWTFLKFLASEENMLFWNLSTGEFPSRKTLVHHPKIVANKNFGPVVALMDAAEHVGYIRNAEEWGHTITGMLENVATRKMTVKEALSHAEEEINKMFAHYDATIPVK